MNRQQRGKFSIDANLVERYPDIVAKAFCEMNLIPFRAELMYAYMKFEYIAISSMFEKVARGAMTPEYDVEIIAGLTVDDMETMSKKCLDCGKAVDD